MRKRRRTRQYQRDVRIISTSTNQITYVGHSSEPNDFYSCLRFLNHISAGRYEWCPKVSPELVEVPPRLFVPSVSYLPASSPMKIQKRIYLGGGNQGYVG